MTNDEARGLTGPVLNNEPLGSHVLDLRIADIVAETADSRSLTFEVPEGSKIPPERLRYAPGQFLTVRIPSERTGSVARCYSLSSSPFTDDRMTITVKRTADGYGSNWLCDNARPGMRMHVLAPSGRFVPDTLHDDFLLVAGGSGITPIMSICKSALAKGNGQVVLLYANRDDRSVIFRDALLELTARYPDRLSVVNWLESQQGLPSAPALAELASPYIGRPAFICGPAPFMQAAREALETLKVASAQIHIEVFKSLDTDPFAATAIEDGSDGGAEGTATAVVELDGQMHTLLWPRHAKLLDVLLEAGLDVPFSCREGHCGSCAATLRNGKVTMEVNDVLGQQDLDDKLILACQSHPETDTVEVTFDE